MTTNTINTLADIKTWQDRTPSSLKYYMAASGPSVFMQYEIADLRAYAEKQEARIAELEAEKQQTEAALGETLKMYHEIKNQLAASQVEAEPVAWACAFDERHVKLKKPDVEWGKENPWVESFAPFPLYAAQPPAPAAIPLTFSEDDLTQDFTLDEIANGLRYDDEDKQSAWLAELNEYVRVERNLAIANAAGDKAVSVEVMRALTDARNTAMRFTLEARVPECGHFGDIAQNLDWALNTIAEGKAVLSRCDAGTTSVIPLTDEELLQIAQPIWARHCQNLEDPHGFILEVSRAIAAAQGKENDRG